MTPPKLTRQGVRDLGGDTSRPRAECAHVYGRSSIVAYRFVWDGPDEYAEEPVYGQRCLHCGHTRRV